MQAKTPATVVTGFLGAGKTTLIRHMLEHANGRRIALIINEFGDVGVDGEILKGCGDELCREDDLIELANGCICCTVADDFIPTMEKLLEREEAPDHIIIETSGLALPQPLVKAFNWPEIRSRVTVDGVITVVDGPAVSEGRFASDPEAVDRQRQADPELDHESPLEELFEDQLNCADLVLINKADLLDVAAMERIRSDLAKDLRAGTMIIDSRHGEVPLEAILGLSCAAEDDLDSRKSHHELEGHEDHDHDDFETFVIELGEITDKDGLLARIADTMRAHDILRLKGFASISGSPARFLVQAVGPRLNGYFERPWKPTETPSTRLVVIGQKGLDQSAIARAIAS